MIKRIVFDLDDTLIPWNDWYFNSIEDALNMLNYDYTIEELQIIRSSIKKYEKFYSKYDRANMRLFFEKNLDRELPLSFMDTWLYNLETCVPHEKDRGLIGTLNELSCDYSLYVFTNWFRCSQVGRLKNAGLLPYFDRIITAEEYLMKPNSEGFIASCSGFKPCECLMIGDDYNMDIRGAGAIGMNSLLIDLKGKYEDYKGAKIKKISDVKKYL